MAERRSMMLSQNLPFETRNIYEKDRPNNLKIDFFSMV